MVVVVVTAAAEAAAEHVASMGAFAGLSIQVRTCGNQRVTHARGTAQRPDVDVQDNPSVASLVSRALIEVVAVSSGRRARAAGKKEAAEPAGADANRIEDER